MGTVGGEGTGETGPCVVGDAGLESVELGVFEEGVGVVPAVESGGAGGLVLHFALVAGTGRDLPDQTVVQTDHRQVGLVQGGGPVVVLVHAVGVGVEGVFEVQGAALAVHLVDEVLLGLGLGGEFQREGETVLLGQPFVHDHEAHYFGEEGGGVVARGEHHAVEELSEGHEVALLEVGGGADDSRTLGVKER